MRTVLCVLAGATLLAACATPYQLSDAALKSSTAMSKDAALQIIKNQLRPTGRQLGMCWHHVYPKPPREGDLARQPPEMNGQIITLTYLASETPESVDEIIGKTLAKAGVARTQVRMDNYLFTFDVTNLVRVFVNKTAHFAACQSKPGGTIVELYNREPAMGTNLLLFQIAPENLDIFLAAFRRLAPDAPIKVPPL